MCTVLLPPGDYPIAVNKYINTVIIRLYSIVTGLPKCVLDSTNCVVPKNETTTIDALEMRPEGNGRRII
jgi:hypothetical protein